MVVPAGTTFGVTEPTSVPPPPPSVTKSAAGSELRFSTVTVQLVAFGGMGPIVGGSGVGTAVGLGTGVGLGKTGGAGLGKAGNGGGDTPAGTYNAAALYVPAGVSPPPLPAFPSPAPPVFPSPTPRPTPLAPAAGPVPPNARTWKVTVDNQSSEPATLFVAEEDEGGMLRLVGSATPNVVPAGATERVTFFFPADTDPDDGWIYVNPRPGEGGSLVHAADIGIPGKIVITADGQVGWLSPPGY